MSNYIEVKNYFINLCDSEFKVVRDEATDVLFHYEEIGKQAGNFIAAKFLIDVYDIFMKEMEKDIEDEKSTY